MIQARLKVVTEGKLHQPLKRVCIDAKTVNVVKRDYLVGVYHCQLDGRQIPPVVKTARAGVYLNENAMTCISSGRSRSAVGEQPGRLFQAWAPDSEVSPAECERLTIHDPLTVDASTGRGFISTERFTAKRRQSTESEPYP